MAERSPLKPEDLERVFAPFEKVDGSASRKYQGTGLGLSLSKRLIELHGGKLCVESAGENQGSTFNFVIPLFIADPLGYASWGKWAIR